MSSTPYIYGLPKTHKPTIPLRPIIAYHLSPAYKLSKYLSAFLTPLVKTRPQSSSITDIPAFIQFVQSLTPFQNSTLVSYDVNSMYLSLPHQLIVTQLTKFLQDIQLDSKTVSSIVALSSICLDITEFTFNNQFFKQIRGSPMGSPLSSPLAEIVMSTLDDWIQRQYTPGIHMWRRYLSTVYFSPFSHAATYFVGFLIGYYCSQNPNLKLSRAAENWRLFKSKWDNYQVATELNKKDNLLIYLPYSVCLSQHSYHSLEKIVSTYFLNLDLKEDEKNSLPKIIEALNNHFTPQKNAIHEWYIFNTSNQEENEGIDSYTNRLRGLASSCEYDILTEELIRDRIVLGIKDNRVRKKLLMEPKLNLSSAIDICRTAEVTEQQWHRKYERKKEATKATNETFEDIIYCRYCGSKHRKASCPAYANQTVPLECQLDSGSTCNIMSLDDYRWVMQERSNNLDISNARLEIFGGVILKPVGQKYLDCYFKENKYNLLFPIVNINQKPLLSAKTIEDLNLVTKHDAVYHLASSSCSRAESIINKYEDVFKGLGISYTSATTSEKNSNWFEVIKIPHFQIPTIDEILPSLNNAKIFTVIDAKDGFWQLKIDSQSSDLTTFWTPFGRYKWLRMPFGRP
ncbi:K02A2.6-like [Cordylochernes scorpioides]|uniref:K02A2.6-like n=1 Tax=Cordylochernes scorpioides TaxID=51811 RepID=A0ABY6LMI0_9ARAC|nr:K02A2.6-like [Cordylochernes scorpioides]